MCARVSRAATGRDPARRAAPGPADRQHPLPDAWEEWARARGLAPPSLAGAIELEGIEEALLVAESGHGLAIGRRPMVDDRLARGTLVAPFGAGDPTGAAFYLCRPSDVPPTAAAHGLERWLRALAVAT